MTASPALLTLLALFKPLQSGMGPKTACTWTWKFIVIFITYFLYCRCCHIWLCCLSRCQREPLHTLSHTLFLPYTLFLQQVAHTARKGEKKESIGKSTSGLNNSSYLNFYLENSHWYRIIELSYSQLKILVAPFLSGFMWWIVTPRLLKPHRGFTLRVLHS